MEYGYFRSIQVNMWLSKCLWLLAYRRRPHEGPAASYLHSRPRANDRTPLMQRCSYLILSRILDIALLDLLPVMAIISFCTMHACRFFCVFPNASQNHIAVILTIAKMGDVMLLLSPGITVCSMDCSDCQQLLTSGKSLTSALTTRTHLRLVIGTTRRIQDEKSTWLEEKWQYWWQMCLVCIMLEMPLTEEPVHWGASSRCLDN